VALARPDGAEGHHGRRANVDPASQ
jgi:hypothetical protein